MQFLKETDISFAQLCTKVGEMIGDESPSKIQSLLVYLLEETSYARYQWEQCLKKNDWSLASKILHREKLFINSLDIFKNQEIVYAIQKSPEDFKRTELQIFYTEMLELFKNIEKLIIQNNTGLPL